MVEKITAAGGTAIFGGILSAAGFVSAHNAGAAQQPEAVKTGIIIALAVLPALTSLLACLALSRYRLPPAPSPGASPSASLIESTTRPDNQSA
jgi:Na+/melibiose symporter-like transporter